MMRRTTVVCLNPNPPHTILYGTKQDPDYEPIAKNYLTEDNPQRPTISWEMEVLDAYYNGSFSITLGPSSNSSKSDCPQVKSEEIKDMFLRIGPQSRGNVSRETYGDKNSYYFHFGRTIFDVDCPKTPGKAFVNFESSNDNLEHAQVWTLTQAKNNDKFTLGGSLTSSFASYNNFWNYIVNTTADTTYPSRCPSKFSLRTLTSNTSATMNATITASSADLSFSFTDPETHYTITGSFSGKHWETGPKILFDKDAISTEGQTEHVKPRARKDRRMWIDKYGKWVFIGVGVVVVIFLLWILWKCCGALLNCLSCCFPCLSKQKRAEKKHRKLMQEHAQYHDQTGYHGQGMTYKAPGH